MLGFLGSYALASFFGGGVFLAFILYFLFFRRA